MSSKTLILFGLACIVAYATAVPFLQPEETNNHDEGDDDYVYPEEEEEYEDPRKYECSNNGDCPPYHYCFHSLWFGAVCETHYKNRTEEYNNYNDVTSCKKTDPETGKEWPDHDLCRNNEEGSGSRDPTYSISRCYEELDYTCHKSYMMPCTPNYDNSGNIIKGEEESCPSHFNCQPAPWSNVTTPICFPEPEDVYYAEQCETPWDCGFSDLEQGFPDCYNGWCSRYIE